MTRGISNQTFVESAENRLGIGKLVSLENSRATIQYFRSPVDNEPVVRIVDADSVERRTLYPETRAYFRNPETDGIEVGRVLDYQQDDDLYLVRFPNDLPRMLSSDQFEVRCRLPISDPTDQLASQVNETAFWHSARSKFVKHLLEQHRLSEGLSALLSSSVEIVAHQASVIRRVLMDPFQRYLLADEVGLGKTIETGVLIRQFTVDEPNDHKTVIIVPESLSSQWTEELTHRFHLGQFLDKTIHVVSNRDSSRIREIISDSRMIVVDEAHHLSSWAWSSDPEDKLIFHLVREATSDLYRRVLLLSATPVLHNEKSFLAMLHLLDPLVYSLDGLDAFKQRIQLRQEIAERMTDLREDEQNFFLGDTLEVLGELLSDDAEFQQLRKSLAHLIEQDVDEDDVRRTELIRSIRSHVSDMWRLNRRILRSRRTESTSAYLPGRGGAKRIVYSCENEAGLFEAIDAWRLTLASALYDEEPAKKLIASKLAFRMDELASCEPRQVAAMAQSRLANSDAESQAVPVREDESEALQGILRAAASCDQAARLQELYRLIGTGNDQVSFVVFCSNRETADVVYEFLDLRLPQGRVLRHSADRSGWTQFKSEHRGYVLVCDRAAEEGLNLQKRGACAIHYDLPFSPNRIEQRMGRLDRFGTGMPVQTAVLICDNSRIQKRWFDLLDDALGVFQRSIATLQYVIEEELQAVLVEFLDLGSDAFIEACERLGGEEGIVAKELKRVAAQDAIDAFDADELTQEFADRLEDGDRELGRKAASAFNDWAVRNLCFRSTGEERRFDDVFTYEFTRRVDHGVRRPYGKDTLLPADEFQRLFSDSIDDLPLDPPAQFTTVPFTFDRVTSQRRACRLLRVGDPFVDSFGKLMRWDDRGVSYAFWRYIPSLQLDADPSVFFRFEFVLSVAVQPLLALCERHTGASRNAVMRRSQVIMPPRFTGMWVDADLERVMPTDSRAKMLNTPYQKSLNGGKDFNLNRQRWDKAATVYDMSLWRDRCTAARAKAEEMLRHQSKLPELSSECIETATERSSKIQQQLRSRLAMADDPTRISLELDLRFEIELLEAQKEAFRNPDLRVDSVGAVFVSNQMPSAELGEDEDED